MDDETMAQPRLDAHWQSLFAHQFDHLERSLMAAIAELGKRMDKISADVESLLLTRAEQQGAAGRSARIARRVSQGLGLALGGGGLLAAVDWVMQHIPPHK